MPAAAAAIADFDQWRAVGMNRRQRHGAGLRRHPNTRAKGAGRDDCSHGIFAKHRSSPCCPFALVTLRCGNDCDWKTFLGEASSFVGVESRRDTRELRSAWIGVSFGPNSDFTPPEQLTGLTKNAAKD
jgi:hypothetical protein